MSDVPDNPLHPDNVTLAAVRKFYFAYHINATVSGRDVVRDKAGPKRAFALLTVFLWKRLKDDREEGAPRVGHFTLAYQHGFMRWCRDERSLSCKTISTYLSYIKAGFRFAATPRLITDRLGRTREAKILTDPPYVVDSEEAVSKETGLPRSKPREWIPTDAELAATLSALRSDDPIRNDSLEATFRYAICALNTIARPEAITELSVASQVRMDAGIIELNQRDRLQTKKVRPTIRLTHNLQAWLLHWNLDRPITSYGRTVSKIDNRTLKAAAKRAKVEEWRRFTRYTFRHYMATRIRRVPGVSVSREERASWMGHTDPEHRTTEQWYESMDADYLENVRAAIDSVMLALDALASVSLTAPGAVAGTRLSVVQTARPPHEAGAKTEGRG